MIIEKIALIWINYRLVTTFSNDFKHLYKANAHNQVLFITLPRHDFAITQNMAKPIKE